MRLIVATPVQLQRRARGHRGQPGAERGAPAVRDDPRFVRRLGDEERDEHDLRPLIDRPSIDPLHGALQDRAVGALERGGRPLRPNGTRTSEEEVGRVLERGERAPLRVPGQVTHEARLVQAEIGPSLAPRGEPLREILLETAGGKWLPDPGEEGRSELGRGHLESIWPLGS